MGGNDLGNGNHERVLPILTLRQDRGALDIKIAFREISPQAAACSVAESALSALRSLGGDHFFFVGGHLRIFVQGRFQRR
jgi:hypothetical protein